MYPQRPSRIWFAAAAAAAVVAVVAATAAIQVQRDADTPIGEGELFVRDAQDALGMVSMPDDPDLVVREIRNDLEIEATSYVDTSGAVVASTSPNLVGRSLMNGVLAFGLSSERFAAVASQIDHEIIIDGVTEWQPGDVLYRVLQPVPGGAVLLDYDISELLARRTLSQGLTGSTIRLSLLAAGMAIIAAAALIGRSRTARRFRAVAREAELLHAHTEELQSANTQLAAARTRAEEALELAEETNRVRADFVLMINHELRTPLTAVVTGADLLRSEPALDSQAKHEILDAMILDGNRLEEMIDQMLAVARIENRGLNVQFAPLDGLEVCANVVSTHPELLHTDHVDELPWAMTDKMTLTQLIHSLVDNARVHGAEQIALECTTTVPFEPDIEFGDRPAQPLTFVISDNGPGIDHDFLPRMFEKYEKDSFSPGTGLGLYLAGMMVDALKGSIAVTTSQEGTRMAVSVAASPSGARTEPRRQEIRQ